MLAFTLTPGNIDDRAPVPKLTKQLFGKLFGDRVYISKALLAELFEYGVQLITKLRSNTKNQLMELSDKLMLSALLVYGC